LRRAESNGVRYGRYFLASHIKQFIVKTHSAISYKFIHIVMNNNGVQNNRWVLKFAKKG